jgi:hypothetical protein
VLLYTYTYTYTYTYIYIYIHIYIYAGHGPTVINNNVSSSAAGGAAFPMMVQARFKYVRTGWLHSDCKRCGKPKAMHISYSGDYWCPDPKPDNCCCTIQ